MIKQKLNALLEKYPDLFVKKGDMPYDYDFEGFRCNDGWYAIVSKFCMHLQSHNEHKEAENRREWQANVDLFVKGMDDEQAAKARATFVYAPRVPIKITSVKEKFGTLSIYMNNPDEWAWGLATMADSMSALFCEDCGTTHNVGAVQGGWIRNICEPCFKLMRESRPDRDERWVVKRNPLLGPLATFQEMREETS